MKKKIFSIALALCMVLTMMPVATGVAWAAASTVKIGTATLDSTNKYYHNGSAGAQGEANTNSVGANATFDSASGTLTLNGLELSNTSGHSIEAAGDLKIVLQQGSNNMLGYSSNTSNIIYLYGASGSHYNLTISGPGTLTAVNGSGSLTTIYATGNITINGGAVVTATHAGGGAQAINADNSGDITISGTGTTVTAENSGNSSNDFAVLATNIHIFDGATLIAEQIGTGTTAPSAVSGTVVIDNVVAGTENKDKVKVGTSASSNDTWSGNTEEHPLTGYKYLKIVSASSLSPVPETTPNANFTATGDTTGTLSGVESGMKYSTDGTSWTDIDSSADVDLTGLSACTISVVKKGNGTTTSDSVAQTIGVTKAGTPDFNATQPTTVGGKGSIPMTSVHEYKLESASGWTRATGTTELEAGTYYVRVAADGTVLASDAKTITINAYSAPSNPGGSYTPTIQKPTIIADEGVETTLSIFGDKLTIKVAEDYELADVIVNGVSKGKVTELTGLKTGDKVEIKTEKKQEEPQEPTKEEIVAALDSSNLVARSKLITLKNGKKAVRITWYDKNGNEINFDGVEIYRSTQRYKGYGLTPFYATKGGKTEGYYVNTRDLKEGTTYYYRVRGYVEIDGQKYYTDYSLKAIRTIK